MRIRVSAATTKIGSRVETTFEIDDDASEEEIEEAAREALFNRLISWDWKKAGPQE